MDQIEKQNITEEQVRDNLENGVILAIKEHTEKLDAILGNLSKKELIRLVKSAARFPDTSLQRGTMKEEMEATQTLFAIKDLQIELAIITLGRQQEENDKQNSEQGETNE